MGERAFFQIAVALIPLLTFGGLLASHPAEENRSSPRKIRAAEPLEAMGILLLGLFAIVAETIAIRGAVTGNTSTVDRLIVISMIYAGMVAIVARAAGPRFARVFDLTVFKGTAFEPKARRWKRAMGVGTNLLQLSRALGHHSAAFTLSRYTHLLPGDEAPALDLSPTTPAELLVGADA